jgi:hypothetical protein
MYTIEKPQGKCNLQELINFTTIITGLFCVLSFMSLNHVFTIQKCKDQDIQNYNLACCFVWV